jgi:5'-nucleotidase
VARALITNDDGIDSPGLWALAVAARDAGLEVVVAAPHRDSSGVGTSVLSVQDDGRTEVHARELPGLSGVEAWAVEGHPAYIVHVAGRGWLDPAPDVVLSGINVGATWATPCCIPARSRRP